MTRGKGGAMRMETVCAGVGSALVVGGVSVIYWPAGMIVLGLLLIVLAVVDRGER